MTNLGIKFKENVKRWFRALVSFFSEFAKVLGEACIILLIIHVPLYFSIIWYLFDIQSNNVTNTAASVFRKTYDAGDILGYTAGLLASSTAFFFRRAYLFSVKPKTTLALTILPLVVLFFASPVFFRELDGRGEISSFASDYVIWLLAAAAIVWLFSLYQQSTIFSPSRDTATESIMSKVERPQ